MCIVMDKLDGGDLVEGLQRHLKVPPIDFWGQKWPALAAGKIEMGGEK